MVVLLLLSHSNLSNVQEQLLPEWLKKVIVRHVIASLGEQNGRHYTESCFIDKAVA